MLGVNSVGFPHVLITEGINPVCPMHNRDKVTCSFVDFQWISPSKGLTSQSLFYMSLFKRRYHFFYRRVQTVQLFYP